MSFKIRWSKSVLIFGGTAIWGMLLVGCVVVQRTVVMPPSIPGATFVGSAKCADCHEEVTSEFHDAAHAKLFASGAKGQEISCESCHGPASLHVKSGGELGTILNPKGNPETCFQCHLDKRGEFNQPHAHPVLSGKMSCNDCHNSHGAELTSANALVLEEMNASCIKCHTTQGGPYVYEHGGTREGCVSCHNPHGTVNEKMLRARDSNLCLSCHALAHTGPGQINANALGQSVANHNARTMQGTCWSAGCHEAVHGSNASYHLRY